MIRRVLNLPYAMIRRRTDARSFKLEAIVVALLGGVGMIGVGFVAWGELSAVAEAPFEAPQLRFALIGKTVEPLFLMFLVWIWYTIGGQIASRHYRGRGPISRLFRTSAWALVPLGIWNIIQSIAMVALFWSVEFPPDPPGNETEAEVRAIMELGLDNPVWLVVAFLGPVFAIWTWHLLALALQRVKTLELDEARRVAAVPAGVYALWLLYDALTWAGLV